MTVRYLLDTNVLIPFFSKDFFLELGKRGLPIRWSLPIEAEFRDVWGRLYPEQAHNGPKVLALMRSAVPDWRAPVSRRVLREVELPDDKDRHVLAAAVGAGAAVIVTKNLRDFPAAVLERYGLVARAPDDVLCDLFDGDTKGFVTAAAAMRARLKAPAMTPQTWLTGVEAGGLKRLAENLAGVSDLL